MVYSSIFAISLLATVVHAQSNNAPFIQKNDWSKPCFDGQCTWDHPTNAGASGGMKIWGSSMGLSDITEAAGWMILDCDPNKMDQDIRLVCKSHDTAGAGCDHLSKDMSPEGKIVRLPNSCGKMPFARVGKFWVPEDQSIPQDKMKKIARRDNAAPQVKAMTIDTKFGSGNATQAGNMNIAIQGANFPGNPAGNVAAPVKGPKRRSRLADRGFFDFVGDAINAISNAANTVVQTVKNGVDAVEGATKINENKNTTLPAIDVNKDFPIFSGSISCPATPPSQPFSATLNADVNTQAHAVITIGIAAVGTIIPPKLDDFSVFSGIDADINAALHVTAQASGTLDSGVKTLFEQGVPGLDFPGIFSIGPTFQINGQLKSQLEVDFDMTVNLAYTAKNAQLVFPPGSNKKSGGDFAPSDSNLKLSANPSITAQGTIEGHIIPTVNLGVNFLNGVAQASVFVDLDASAILDLQLEAAASLSAGTGQKAAVNGAGVDGCVDLKGALSVDVGAKGSFFGFFNDQTKESLFNKNFELFKKCFNATQAPPASSAGNADQSGNSTAVTAAKAAAQAVQIASGANSPQAAIAAGVEAAASAAEQSATPSDKSAAPSETSAGSADKAITPTDKTTEKSAAPAKGSSKKASRSRLARRSLQKRDLQKRAPLGCGTQSVTTSLTSIVQQVIGSSGITAI